MTERMRKMYAMRDIVGMVTSLDELTEEKVNTLGMDAMWFLGCYLKPVDYEVTENVKVSGGKKKTGRKAHMRANALKNKSRYGKTNPSRKERKAYKKYADHNFRIYNGGIIRGDYKHGHRGRREEEKIAEAMRNAVADAEAIEMDIILAEQREQDEANIANLRKQIADWKIIKEHNQKHMDLIWEKIALLNRQIAELNKTYEEVSKRISYCNRRINTNTFFLNDFYGVDAE